MAVQIKDAAERIGLGVVIAVGVAALALLVAMAGLAVSVRCLKAVKA